MVFAQFAIPHWHKSAQQLRVEIKVLYLLVFRIANFPSTTPARTIL